MRSWLPVFLVGTAVIAACGDSPATVGSVPPSDIGEARDSGDAQDIRDAQTDADVDDDLDVEDVPDVEDVDVPDVEDVDLDALDAEDTVQDAVDVPDGDIRDVEDTDGNAQDVEDTGDTDVDDPRPIWVHPCIDPGPPVEAEQWAFELVVSVETIGAGVVSGDIDGDGEDEVLAIQTVGSAVLPNEDFTGTRMQMGIWSVSDGGFEFEALVPEGLAVRLVTDLDGDRLPELAGDTHRVVRRDNVQQLIPHVFLSERFPEEPLEFEMPPGVLRQSSGRPHLGILDVDADGVGELGAPWISGLGTVDVLLWDDGYDWRSFDLTDRGFEPECCVTNGNQGAIMIAGHHSRQQWTDPDVRTIALGNYALVDLQVESLELLNTPVFSITGTSQADLDGNGEFETVFNGGGFGLGCEWVGVVGGQPLEIQAQTAFESDSFHPGKQAAADLDCDGRSEVVVSEGTRHTVLRLRNGQFELVYTSTDVWDELVPADIDGDGCAELIGGLRSQREGNPGASAGLHLLRRLD